MSTPVLTHNASTPIGSRRSNPASGRTRWAEASPIEPHDALVDEPDRGILHQGDVFRAILFPRWDLNSYRLSGPSREEKVDGSSVDVLAYEDLDPDRADVGLR